MLVCYWARVASVNVRNCNFRLRVLHHRNRLSPRLCRLRRRGERRLDIQDWSIGAPRVTTALASLQKSESRLRAKPAITQCADFVMIALRMLKRRAEKHAAEPAICGENEAPFNFAILEGDVIDVPGGACQGWSSGRRCFRCPSRALPRHGARTPRVELALAFLHLIERPNGCLEHVMVLSF